MGRQQGTAQAKSAFAHRVKYKIVAFIILGEIRDEVINGPVGAQGFNLGLRDAAALAQALLQNHRLGADPGAPALLDGYAAARQADRSATTGLSHALALGTGMHSPAAGWLRSLALIADDRIEPLAEHLLLGGMGYRGNTPALARGAHP